MLLKWKALPSRRVRRCSQSGLGTSKVSMRRRLRHLTLGHRKARNDELDRRGLSNGDPSAQHPTSTNCEVPRECTAQLIHLSTAGCQCTGNAQYPHFHPHSRQGKWITYSGSHKYRYMLQAPGNSGLVLALRVISASKNVTLYRCTPHAILNIMPSTQPVMPRELTVSEQYHTSERALQLKG
jgi:hypothetical protein